MEEQNRITRKKAAEILGVDPQTITNYFNEGLLGGFKGKKNILYVNADDVAKYADKYRFIAVSERMINDKIEEIHKIRNNVCNELAESRRVLFNGYLYGISVGNVARTIAALYEAGYIPEMKKRERDILTEYIMGRDTQMIAEEYDLSVGRIQQIISRACRRIYEQTDAIAANIRKGREAQREVSVLKVRLEKLRQQYKEYRIQHEDKAIPKTEPPKILSAKIVDYNISVRSLNCLKAADIETIGDLLTNYASAQKLRGLRNFGKKSAWEIENFVKSQGLLFKGKDESEEEYYERLNRALNHNDDESKDKN